MINTTNAFQELSYKFAISLDESTDIKNIAYPLSFVRYIHNEDINDDLLSCQALHERTVWIDIFERVDNLGTKMRLEW